MCPVPVFNFDREDEAAIANTPSAKTVQELKCRHASDDNLEFLIRKNFSSLAASASSEGHALLFSSCSSPTGSISGAASGGPDSPYSRLSQNLSQLLDEVDAEDDARLLSRMTGKQPDEEDSLYHHKTGGDEQRVLIVEIKRPNSVHPDDIINVLVSFGHVPIKSYVNGREAVCAEFTDGEDAVSARSFLEANLSDNILSTSLIPAALFDSGRTATQSKASRSIWVGHVGTEVTDDMLRRVFEVHGPIESIKRMEGRGCAFVNFRQMEHAIIARKALNNSRLGGGIIKTGFAKTTSSSPTADSDESDLRSPQLITAPEQFLEPPEDAFLDPIPPLPDGVDCCEDIEDTVALKAIRIELEQQSTAYADAIFAQYKHRVLSLALDAMGNIVVQKLAERGGLERRLYILGQLAPHLAFLSCHKNGTWVVQKFVALSSNNPSQPGGDTDKLKTLIIDSLRPYFVALLKDQCGNYVVQGCLALGWPHAVCLLECLRWRCVEIARSRFGARAMKSLLEPLSARYYDHRFARAICRAAVEGAAELAGNPHGALLLGYLVASGHVTGGSRDGECSVEALVQNMMGDGRGLLQSRYTLATLEVVLSKHPDFAARMADLFAQRTDMARLLCDQGISSLLLKVLGAHSTQQLARKIASALPKAAIHSDQHADNLLKLKQLVCEQ